MGLVEDRNGQVGYVPVVFVMANFYKSLVEQEECDVMGKKVVEENRTEETMCQKVLADTTFLLC